MVLLLGYIATPEEEESDLLQEEGGKRNRRGHWITLPQKEGLKGREKEVDQRPKKVCSLPLFDRASKIKGRGEK